MNPQASCPVAMLNIIGNYHSLWLDTAEKRSTSDGLYPNDWLEIVEISSGRDSELNSGAHVLHVAIERPHYCQLQPNTIFFNEQETMSVDKVCN